MKTVKRHRLLALIGVGTFLAALLGTTAANAKEKVREIPLDEDAWAKITFDDIAPTDYKAQKGILTATVDQSASALIYAFDQPQTVQAAGFQWQNQGTLKVKSAKHEASKVGDDALLRVGVMIAGPKPTIPFFAPAWIKKTASALKQPSDRMIYLTVGSKHKTGKSWSSPYADSIHSVAVASEKAKNSWQTVNHRFKTAQSVVGLWLMADGDNTGSQFQVKLKNLQLIIEDR